MKVKLTEICKGGFVEDVNSVGPESEYAWESWGDYQHWHIEVFRSAIIKRYGAAHVGPLTMGDNDIWFFNHSDDVNWNRIGDDIGVSNSGPSESSSSSSSSESSASKIDNMLALKIARINKASERRSVPKPLEMREKK